MADPDAPKRVRVRNPSQGWEGLTWRPHPIFARPGETDYQFAIRMGFCRDPLPPDGEPVLVQWDDRPGALSVHSWKELEVIDEGS